MKITNLTNSGLPVILTKDEYRLLVKLSFQQLFMMESLVDQQNSKEFERISMLSSKLIKYAPDFASNDLIAHDVVNDMIFPSTSFIDSIMESIAEYDEVSFWEELTHKLAERDMLREHSNEELEEMTEEDYLSKLSEKLVLYTDKLGEDGLDGVVVT